MTTNDSINLPYKPAILLTDKIGWGLSLKLESITSKRNWGIGDFTDLKNLIAWASDQGASFVKVAPLFEKNIDANAPSRETTLIYDPIYLDIEIVPDFDESLSIQRLLLAPDFQKKIETLKRGNYTAIREAKLFAANQCYKHFRDSHIRRATVRASNFRAFQKKEKTWLRPYAIFKAWQEIYAPAETVFGSAAIPDEFVLSNYERIEFFEYMQWLIDVQLAQIGDYCLSRHMPIGLCLAIEELSSHLHSNRPLTKDQFVSIVTLLMYHSGAIVISANSLTANEHILPTPDELLDWLTLESQRSQCLIIMDTVNNLSANMKAKVKQFTTLQDFSSIDIHADDKTKLIYFELENILTPSNSKNDSSLESEHISFDQIGSNKTLKLAIEAMNKIAHSKFASEDRSPPNQESRALIPRATYRLQFNKTFTLKDAINIVPYLAGLGISHCYASPLLQANAGSMHGYDIVNHNKINSEIGSSEDFDNFIQALKASGMGLILDIVPNHMGTSNENPWWWDVLENGTSSIYSDYFDIDWQPVKKELFGKVLLPILGEPYGKVLKSGQLKLHFNAEQGTFTINYFSHLLPINPLSYSKILDKRLNILKERFGTKNENVEEYLSILNGFIRLNENSANSSSRFREQRVQMKRLHELCNKQPQINEFIEQNLQEFDVNSPNINTEQSLHDLLEEQAYRLSFWRVSSDEINYRRFFDIDSLVAIRMEDARVFAEMHHLIFKLIKDRKVDGLRIDHPDGLFDPTKYFEDLQQEAAKSFDLPYLMPPLNKNTFDTELAPFYIVVEKILAPFEHLPADWQVHGTVGYDYLNSVLRLLIDTENKEDFENIYSTFTFKSVDIDLLKLECKDLILDSVLASELNVLAHRLSQIAESSWYLRDFTLGSIRDALKQIIKYFPVYRTYINGSPIDKASRNYIDWAVQLAKGSSSAINARVYDFLYSVLTLDILDSIDEFSGIAKDDFKKKILLFVMRFQQYTGPVMAKSIEDTMFYHYNRFIALNEVGGEPEKFGMHASAFHFQNQQRQLKRPYEMISTATHDTKRSEDMRARLAALSEIPLIWREKILLWQRINKPRKTLSDDQIFPDSNDEYLIYQTLVGVLPVEWNSSNSRPKTEDIQHLTERIEQYVLKAVREAKVYTSWINQNETYEQFILSFVGKILCSNNNPFLDDLLIFHDSLKDFGLINSLVQTVLKLTSPGIPDLYQGSELWDFSLVDPDNRRSVNFDMRQNFLAKNLSLANLISNRNNGGIKFFITKTCLDYRKRESELFMKGKYIPLEVIGPAKDNLLAYARLLNDKLCITAVPLKVIKLLKKTNLDNFITEDTFKKLIEKTIWQETKILLPSNIQISELRNIFSNESIACLSNAIDCAAIFKDIPVSVMHNQS